MHDTGGNARFPDIAQPLIPFSLFFVKEAKV